MTFLQYRRDNFTLLTFFVKLFFSQYGIISLKIKQISSIIKVYIMHEDMSIMIKKILLWTEKKKSRIICGKRNMDYKLDKSRSVKLDLHTSKTETHTWRAII